MAASSHWRVAWSAYIRRGTMRANCCASTWSDIPGTLPPAPRFTSWGASRKATGLSGAARTFYTRLAAQFPNYYYGILARERMAQPEIVAAGPSEKTAQFLRPIAFRPHRPAVPRRTRRQIPHYASRARACCESAGLAGSGAGRIALWRAQRRPALSAGYGTGARRETPHERLHNIKSAAPDYLAMSLEDAPPAFWQLLFPLPYEKDLVRNAKQQSLDPYMMAALIRQESEFDPQALSPSTLMA